MYKHSIIGSIKHKGLARFFEHGDKSKIPTDQVRKIEDILESLRSAAKPADLALPEYRLHKLKGNRQGLWSMRVSRNWRIVFRFDGRYAYDVDLIDYH